jgi:TonB family protein
MKMKRLLPITPMFWLIVASAIVQGQTSAPVAPAKQAPLDTWNRYRVSGERFSVKLPTVPAMTTQTLYLLDRRTRRRERTLGAYADGAVYVVNIYQNVAGESLERFIAEQNKRGTWDLSTERIVTINDVNGKEYSWRDKVIPRVTQFFKAYDHFFQFTAGGEGADDAVKQFFSSIVLSKDVDGIAVSDGPGVPFPGPSDEQAFPGKEVDRKVRLMTKPEPSYTETARQKQITGTVVLKAVFSSNGTVEKIQVLVELPDGLTEKAIDAARMIKFYPAVKDGKSVATLMHLEYNFNLY